MHVFLFLFLIPLSLFSVNVTEAPPAGVEGEFLPWFTGPLLAGSGRTCPKNHYVVQPYYFLFSSASYYDEHWKNQRAPSSLSSQPSLLYLFGITDWMDSQIIGTMVTNVSRGQSSTRIGDTSLNFGFQLLQDQRNSWRPDLRLVLKQDFPTGHYQHLNPKKQGTDISGSGLYRIGLGTNFQKIYYLGKHLLRGRFNLTYKISPTTHIEGISVYGGSPQTQGHIDALHYYSFNVAFEYTLTQNITFAIDVLYEGQSKAQFKGIQDLNRFSAANSVVSPKIQLFSLAPALEYNFSNDVGIIAGSWFTVAGKNAANFASFTISFNYYR